MKIWVLFLLGLFVSCQPAVQSTNGRIDGGSVRDEKNSLGDELFNKTWYRDRAPGVVTSYKFEADGRLTVRGLVANDLDTPVPGYDENWTYELDGPQLITIDHDFYSEQYTYTIEEEAMRMCDPYGQCTDFFTLIEM